MTTELSDFLTDALARNRDAVAFVTPDGQRLTYDGLAATIEAFAAHAQGQIAEGDFACIEVPHSAVTLCLAFAISRLGGVPVLGSSVSETQAGDVRVDAVVSNRVRATPEPRSILFHQGWMDWPQGYTPGTPWPKLIGECDPLVILSSSGSTGHRKFMPFSAANFRIRIPNHDAFLTHYDRRMICMALTSLIGFSATLRSLSNGGMIVEPGASDAHTLRLLEENGVEELMAAPMTLDRLIRQQERKPVQLISLKQVLIGGSSVSPELLARTKSVLCENAVIAYGTSETGYMARLKGDDIMLPGAVGQIAPWARVDVLGDNGTVLGAGEAGLIRIHVEPDYAVDGYIAAEERTGSDLKNGVFIPGDIGAVLSDGMLTITGREDDVINAGGNKISAQAIESTVLTFAGITQTAAAAMPGKSGIDTVLVVYDGQPETGEAELRKALTRTLGGVIPFRLEPVDDIPLLATRKVDRQALIRKFSES